MQIAWFERWVEAERGRFVLFLPVAMSAGTVGYFERTTEPELWQGAAMTATTFLLGLLLRSWRIPRSVCALACAGAIGFTAAEVATSRAAPVVEIPTHATLVVGTVASIDLLPSGRRVLITHPSLDGAPALSRAVRLHLRTLDATPIQTGDTVRVRAMLSRPQPPAYPGGWDLQRDAYFAGIGAFGYGLNPSEIIASGSPDGFGLVQRLREHIAARIATVLDGAQAAIATTLLTGSTSAIPDNDRAAFRDSGLSHLLAIAGLHIGIVMGLLFGATRGTLALSERAALQWPLKSIAALTALLAGGLYLTLTGAHVPIIRSFAMASLVTLGLLAGRRALSLRGLALAMACIVLIAPSQVVGVSFQMSFSAVLALIVGYAALRPLLARLHGDGWARRLLAHIVALALTSALAGTFSAPFGAYHFGHIQLYFVLANMVAVPITALLVMPAGLVSLALMPLHLEILSLHPMGWGISAILWIAYTVAGLPAATLAVPHIAPWGLALFSLGLAWLGLWRSRLRLAGIAVMIAGLASPLFVTLPDILVSADARVIALRLDGVMLVQKASGASTFTQNAWLQYWALSSAQPLACVPTNCLLQSHSGDAGALLLRAEADFSSCDQKLLISAEPIRLRCPNKMPLVDRFSAWRNGAHAIWLGHDDITVLSDRASRGTRPWVLGLPLAGRVPPNTRPALSE